MNDLETEEDLDVASDWYPLQSGHMIDFIETTEQWMSSAKEKILNSLDDRSECWRHSGSSRSSKASSTSIASGRAKERVKAAEQYLEGEPKELIKGCLHLDSQNRYTEAMKLLLEKYGDLYKIANAYIKKVNDWPYIRQGDDQALDRFATFLTQCRSVMSELTFLSILDHPHNIQTMVRKFPLSLPRQMVQRIE